MKILFLTILRTTNVSERGIYKDLVRELARRGNDVYVACPTERRFKQKETVIESQGVKILQVKTLNIQKTNVVEKGIGTLLMEYQFKKALKKHWGDIDFDLVIYTTPPITFNKIIAWQKSRGARTYLMLKDIFPQNAVDLGMMKKGSIIWNLFRKKEQTLYEISDRIGCMSPANCEFVIKNNPRVRHDKVGLCPNCVEIDAEAIPETKDKSILKQYGIPQDTSLFIYGGNLGKPQGIHNLIAVLDKVKNREDLFFCIVGSGTESEKLHAWHNVNHPANVKLLNQLAKEDYNRLVAAADVGMIFLDNRFTIPNFPSRLLGYLEKRLPILAATDVHSDVGSIAEENEFGFWSESSDISSIVSNIEKLASSEELRSRMGENGYRFLLENYTIDKAADAILRN